jgi:hypothetical protein
VVGMVSIGRLRLLLLVRHSRISHDLRHAAVDAAITNDAKAGS